MRDIPYEWSMFALNMFAELKGLAECEEVRGNPKAMEHVKAMSDLIAYAMRLEE